MRWLLLFAIWAACACVPLKAVLAESGKLVHLVSFSDYEEGPIDDWLVGKGFRFERDASRRDRIDLDVGENGLVIEAKRRVHGIMTNESVNVPEFSFIEIDWGVNRLSIKIGDKASKITSLSGGNQQKVLIGRAFAMQPDILVLNDPARGIDVETKSELYKHLRDYASRGNSVSRATRPCASVSAISCAAASDHRPTACAGYRKWIARAAVPRCSAAWPKPVSTTPRKCSRSSRSMTSIARSTG